jgi:prepilin-type N-terminal cleavage/methylation domain-containing protein
MKAQERGFTLIEIAIVLVIIGLLLGGVLKGQELISGARVRNFIQQQDGIKAAYFGFLDRYRALPGDYAQATNNIPNVAVTAACNNGNGNGDGQVTTANNENILMWEHLSRAEFINGAFTCAAAATAATSPTNPYGAVLDFGFDNDYRLQTGARHNLKTGDQVPSNILAEIDRKIDDGNPTQGTFRAPTADNATCFGAAWVTAPTPSPDCEGRTLF